MDREATLQRKVFAAIASAALPLAVLLPASPASATPLGTVTFTASPRSVAQNGQITLSGSATFNGSPAANEQITIRRYSNSHDPENITATTDGSGNFTRDVTLDDSGAHLFSAVVNPAAASAAATTSADAGTATAAPSVVAWSVPPSVPTANGTLTSSNGVVFAPGVRTTTVGGTVEANRYVGIVVYPGGTFLGDVQADGNGNFQKAITLPDGFDGDYTIAALNAVTLSVGDIDPTVVTKAVTLPVTVHTAPATVPQSAGPLTSSAGISFTSTSRSTTVSASGFEPGTSVSVLVYSSPTLLGTTTVDQTGAFHLPVTLPGGMAGNHTFIAMGQAAGSSTTRVLSLPITVAGTGSALAVTGVAAWLIVAVGIAALIAGGGLTLAGRRRRVSFVIPD